MPARHRVAVVESRRNLSPLTGLVVEHDVAAVVVDVDAVGLAAEPHDPPVVERELDRGGVAASPNGSSTRTGRARLGATVLVVGVEELVEQVVRAARARSRQCNGAARAAQRLELVEARRRRARAGAAAASGDHGSSGSGRPASIASPTNRSSTAWTAEPASSGDTVTMRSGSSRVADAEHVGRK